ncbi:hypothetical protein B4U80_11792, partial [Leptotrombidium deliense]
REGEEQIAHFLNPLHYFETALRLYNTLDFETKISGLQRDTASLLPVDSWDTVYKSFGPNWPVVNIFRLWGKEIAGLSQLIFCFNFTNELQIPCRDAANSESFKHLYHPPTYQRNFDYLTLRLRTTLSTPFMKIKDMIPSYFYNNVHKSYISQREVLLEAFEHQMLHDPRYALTIEQFQSYWILPSGADTLLETLKDIFKYSGLVLYQMKERIQNPMDYFILVTERYKNLTNFDSLFGYKLGDTVKSMKEFKYNVAKANYPLLQENMNIIFFCNRIHKSQYLREIRICYSADTLQIISCPESETYGRGLKLNEQKKTHYQICNDGFKIPQKGKELKDRS